jgi:uncharacterized protein
MADITPAIPEGRQLVEGYGEGRFRIAGTVHEGSVIVFPDRTVGWEAAALADATEASLGAVFAAAGLDLLLLGCGVRMAPPPAALRLALRHAGIALEAMDTGAACRTFNVLMAEERRVAAALIAV